MVENNNDKKEEIEDITNLPVGNLEITSKFWKNVTIKRIGDKIYRIIR